MRQIDCLANMMIRSWVSTADCAAAGIMCYHKRREEMLEEFYMPIPMASYFSSNARYLIGGKQYKLESRERTVKTRWDRPAKIKEFRLVRVRG